VTAPTLLNPGFAEKQVRPMGDLPWAALLLPLRQKMALIPSNSTNTSISLCYMEENVFDFKCFGE